MRNHRSSVPGGSRRPIWLVQSLDNPLLPESITDYLSEVSEGSCRPVRCTVQPRPWCHSCLNSPTCYREGAQLREAGDTLRPPRRWCRRSYRFHTWAPRCPPGSGRLPLPRVLRNNSCRPVGQWAMAGGGTWRKRLRRRLLAGLHYNECTNIEVSQKTSPLAMAVTPSTVMRLWAK